MFAEYTEGIADYLLFFPLLRSSFLSNIYPWSPLNSPSSVSFPVPFSSLIPALLGQILIATQYNTCRSELVSLVATET